MLKREIKINFKNFLIWTLILICLFLVVYLIYPSIMNSSNLELLNEMLEMFPKEILTAFNMDITTIDSAFGWLKTEGFVFLLLIIGTYSGILGSNILLKEENDKTIEYLNSLPIKRSDIVLSKILCGLFYIFLMVFSVGIFNYIGLSLSGTFDKKLYLLLSITPSLSSIVIFALCLFVSTFTHKTKKTLGISLGFVFISYFLQIISEMSEKTEFLKFFSVFTLADIRNVIVNVAINPTMILVSVTLSLGLIILTLVHYNKKELI